MIRKNLLCILCILCCALSLSACGQTNVTRSIGESKTFSKEDITSAMDQAEQYFSDHFPDCTLKSLAYDETYQEQYSFPDKTRSTEHIVLRSDFHSGKEGKNGDNSLNPDSDYTDWNWVLTRSEDGSWSVADYGY